LGHSGEGSYKPTKLVPLGSCSHSSHIHIYKFDFDNLKDSLKLTNLLNETLTNLIEQYGFESEAEECFSGKAEFYSERMLFVITIV